MEQHERLFQVEEANKRLKKEAKQGGQTLSADNLVVRTLSPSSFFRGALGVRCSSLRNWMCL